MQRYLDACKKATTTMKMETMLASRRRPRRRAKMKTGGVWLSLNNFEPLKRPPFFLLNRPWIYIQAHIAYDAQKFCGDINKISVNLIPFDLILLRKFPIHYIISLWNVRSTFDKCWNKNHCSSNQCTTSCFDAASPTRTQHSHGAFAFTIHNPTSTRTVRPTAHPPVSQSKLIRFYSIFFC